MQARPGHGSTRSPVAFSGAKIEQLTAGSRGHDAVAVTTTAPGARARARLDHPVVDADGHSQEFLPAINEYHTEGSISRATCNTYIHWIVGDVLKHNKTERYLAEVLRGIKITYGSQVSWNRLSKHLSIDHHRTVSDYCQILSDIHVLHIQEAIIEHKLTGAPKKDRKLVFRDPFIGHAISLYLDSGLRDTSSHCILQSVRRNGPGRDGNTIGGLIECAVLVVRVRVERLSVPDGENILKLDLQIR